MRLSHGSLSSFCSAGPLSLAPTPRPPYFVVVGSDVFRYESYSKGQFCAQTFGSVVSSPTSTSRTNGCRASCLRSKMFVSSARTRTVSTPTTANAATITSQPGRRPAGFIGPRPASAAGSVTGAGMTVHAVELPPGRRRVHGLDEVAVAAQAVLLRERPIVRGDLDRLFEVLEREGHGVPEAVVRLGHPLGQARGGQMALDAGRRVPVSALEPCAVLIVHDVAVHARARVRREIRETLGIAEGEGPHPGQQPK